MFKWHFCIFKTSLRTWIFLILIYRWWNFQVSCFVYYSILHFWAQRLRYVRANIGGWQLQCVKVKVWDLESFHWCYSIPQFQHVPTDYQLLWSFGLDRCRVGWPQHLGDKGFYMSYMSLLIFRWFVSKQLFIPFSIFNQIKTILVRLSSILNAKKLFLIHLKF